LPTIKNGMTGNLAYRVDFNERFSEQIDDTVAENEFYLRILIKIVLALDPKYL
jgi:hypothetical protein